MRKGWMWAAAALVVWTGTATGPASAGIPRRVEAVCPVNDQKFFWTTTASYSTFGSELDGQPFGSWTFPLTIPQCPESRFPVYREFTDAEKTAIRALVATPDYAAIKDEASYYVLAFVIERLDQPAAIDKAWVLLQASWQVRDTDPARYGRYAAEIVPAMDAALPAMQAEEPADWWYFQIATANVLRQSGDFAGATARLDALQGQPPGEGDLVQRVALTRELIAAGNQASAHPPTRFDRDE